MAPINEYLLGIIFWWEIFSYHFQSFLWTVNYVIYNDKARECIDRPFPWDEMDEHSNGDWEGPIVNLRYDRKYWPTFISSQKDLERFIWHCSYWFTILCRSKIFRLYRAGTDEGLGFGVELKDKEGGGKWTVTQVRCALFMAVHHISSQEDLRILAEYNFPSIYQTSQMKKRGTCIDTYNNNNK